MIKKQFLPMAKIVKKSPAQKITGGAALQPVQRARFKKGGG